MNERVEKNPEGRRKETIVLGEVQPSTLTNINKSFISEKQKTHRGWRSRKLHSGCEKPGLSGTQKQGGYERRRA